MTTDLLDRFIPVEAVIWELPKTFRKIMKVPVRVVATRQLLQEMDDGAVEQAVNVASLPGIVEASLLMPDAHVGYGFAIGGVAAFNTQDGVISPGGIGFDISCGVRLFTTPLNTADILPKIKQLVDELFQAIPSGVGAKGFIKITPQELKDVMVKGANWAVEKGFGQSQDLENTEDHGVLLGAKPDCVSDRAVERGLGQLGTLGSGNHYLEVQKVGKIFDLPIANSLGIEQENQVVVTFHCGSRGFGHQIGTDYLRIFASAMEKYGIRVPDIQLACAPFTSKEGQRYFAAMKAGANCALANRQIIAHRVREVFHKVLGVNPMMLTQVYDVSHNTAKLEKHQLKGGKIEVIVHRKGATRAFEGQPVMIGGSMETGSYLLLGTKTAEQLTFSSTAHGSGRTMSRVKAKKMVQGQYLQKDMEKRGIYVKSSSFAGLAEEAGFAYKDIHEVVRSIEQAAISQPVASFLPIGNIKG